MGGQCSFPDWLMKESSSWTSKETNTIFQFSSHNANNFNLINKRSVKEKSGFLSKKANFHNQNKKQNIVVENFKKQKKKSFQLLFKDFYNPAFFIFSKKLFTQFKGFSENKFRKEKIKETFIGHSSGH